MNYNFKKKGNIFTGVVVWIFATFFYFMIGLPIINSVVDSMINEGVISDPLFVFTAQIAPFIPIIGLLYMAWLSTQSADEEGGGLSSLLGGR